MSREEDERTYEIYKKMIIVIRKLFDVNNNDNMPKDSKWRVYEHDLYAIVRVFNERQIS